MAYRYFIHLAYNGAAYGGWQVQPNTSTVQQLVNDGLAAIAGVKSGATGCGRTDAGVHASSFFAHFDYHEALSTHDLAQLTFRLNRFLPQDIVAFTIKPVVPGAHARYSALWREYEYLVTRRKDPFNIHHAYFIHGDLDIKKMNDGCALLTGSHDFRSFSKVHTQVNNFFCEVHSARWEADAHFLKFTIRADRFLRNMVRAIVGTLLDVGRGKITITDFWNIIDSKNRSAAGYSVPAKALTLTGVGYPDEIFVKEPVFFSPEGCNKIISHYYTDSEFHQRSGNKTNE